MQQNKRNIPKNQSQQEKQPLLVQNSQKQQNTTQQNSLNISQEEQNQISIQKSIKGIQTNLSLKKQIHFLKIILINLILLYPIVNYFCLPVWKFQSFINDSTLIPQNRIYAINQTTFIIFVILPYIIFLSYPLIIHLISTYIQPLLFSKHKTKIIGTIFALFTIAVALNFIIMQNINIVIDYRYIYLDNNQINYQELCTEQKYQFPQNIFEQICQNSNNEQLFDKEQTKEILQKYILEYGEQQYEYSNWLPVFYIWYIMCNAMLMLLYTLYLGFLYDIIIKF